MVVIVAYFFEVVVLAADAETFLAVDGATARRGTEAEEYVLELIHPGVGEEQRLVADGDNRRAGDKLVVPALKELDKAGSYLFCGQCHICSAKLGCRIVFSYNNALVQTAGYFFEGLYEPVNHNNNKHNDGYIKK